MKKSSVPWSLKQFNRMYKKGSISFDHPIQRRGNQWNNLQKSLLIHSLVSDYPVPNIYAVVDELDGKNVYFILDGKQRLMTINEFLNNEFALHEDTPSVTIDGEEYILAKKIFADLDEEVKEELESRTLTVTKFDEVDDDEIEEIFFRLNNGVNLSKDQKTRAKLGSTLVKYIDELCNHDAVKKISGFTKNQFKRSEDQTIILQCLMLLSDFDYKDFSTDEVGRFAIEMRENFDKGYKNYIDQLKNIFDYVVNAYGDKESFMLRKINFPMTIYQAKKAMEKEVPVNLFKEWSLKFKKDYKEVEEFPYKEYCGHGTTKKIKVIGRLEEMDNHFNAFIKNF